MKYFHRLSGIILVSDCTVLKLDSWRLTTRGSINVTKHFKYNFLSHFLLVTQYD